MWDKKRYLGGLVALMVILAACAPTAGPVAVPAPAAPQAASSLPAPVAPAISAEEPAWQKVVETAKREGRLLIYSASGLSGDAA